MAGSIQNTGGIGPVELVIMRHGEAVARAPTDRERSLTDRGRAQARQQTEDNRERLQGLSAIISSPYLRARQTASEVIRVLGYQGELTFSDNLVPNGGPESLTDFLQSIQGENGGKLMLVSHQPLVGEVLAWLTDQPELAHMGTASIASVSVDTFARGCGTLNWLEHSTR